MSPRTPPRSARDISISAAALLRACLWLPMSYKGAFCYEMQAGMGDTIFAPYYEVLKKRGVKFEFFHRLTNMGLGKGKDHIAYLAASDLKLMAWR